MTDTNTPNSHTAEKPLFSADSIMGVKDLRKMVYIATFFRNYFTIPFIMIICFIGNYVIGRLSHVTDFGLMFNTYFFLLCMTFFLIAFRIERRNKNRIKYDGALIIDNPLRLNFYETRVESTTGQKAQTASLPYSSFFQLMETKDYFMFYHNVTQLSLLRKREVEDVEAFREFIVPKFKGKYKRIKFI